MSKRNRREHGRILSVETMQRGDSLALDAVSGATSITVNDAGDFDEDGGWLYIGAQTVEYTGCDDETGVITLATALAAAGEQGDPVHLWSDLYGEVVDYQLALVELDGEYDNPDPVVAEVAEGVGVLPDGDRGKAGESCTLLRVADDEWEVVGVGGRPASASGTGMIRFEQDDSRSLSAADITAGTATLSLTHRPIDEALTCVLAGVPQQPTEWTINYAAQTLTIPLDGWEAAGDVLWVHYAYLKGITTADVPRCVGSEGAPISYEFSEPYPSGDGAYVDITVTMTPGASGEWTMIPATRDFAPGGYSPGWVQGWDYAPRTVTGGVLSMPGVPVAQYPDGALGQWGSVVGVMIYPNYAPWNAGGSSGTDPSKDTGLPQVGSGQTLGTSTCDRNRYYLGEKIATQDADDGGTQDPYFTDPSGAF